jgi:hypothetical protein
MIGGPTIEGQEQSPALQKDRDFRRRPPRIYTGAIDISESLG